MNIRYATRRSWRLVPVGTLLLCAMAARGQQSPTAQQLNERTPLRTSDAPTSPGMQRRDSLTSAQIEESLQQHPELIVELKSVLADMLEQQNIHVLADSITDEQLTQQIALSSSLRLSITDFLRTRGYVSQADLQRSPLDVREGDEPIRQAANPDLDQLTPQIATTLPALNADQPATTERGAVATPLAEVTTSRRSSTSAGRTLAQADSMRREPNVTDVPDGVHQPTPYNLLSLRDLYTQIPQDDQKLTRFGSEAFLHRDGLSRPSPQGLSDAGIGVGSGATIDVPIGPDYILGAGDGIVINMWGGVSQTLSRTVDREGKVALPESGSLVVAGLSLDRAQQLIEAALKQQFRNAHADVTIARLRTVRIYVVGDVQRPGAYDISSLSTPLMLSMRLVGPPEWAR